MSARAEVDSRAASNIDLAVADVHALDFPDETFDVVHAHQVLQHVADPVRALAEMGRVCRPEGIVAARDSDYAAFAWFPGVPALDEWLLLYRRAARANGGEPDAGRRLLSWARAAGFTDVTSEREHLVLRHARGRLGGGARCGPSGSCPRIWPANWWVRIWPRTATCAGSAPVAGVGTPSADAWFAVLHGEVICRP